MTDIYVVSGFLGAGKTTLIQKFLREEFKNKKVVLIENDFGEMSIDAALLSGSGVEVKEMNSGCICCSLSGDFVKSILEIMERFTPDTIIIEPSGVGKLSEVIKACNEPKIKEVGHIKGKITVVDVKRCHMYVENFGEFFEDQIRYADTIILSKVEQFQDKIDDALKLIASLNSKAFVFSKLWKELQSKDILMAHPKKNDHVCCGTHNHKAYDHGNSCDCNHSHDAEDVFDTVTIRTKSSFTKLQLEMKIQQMEKIPFVKVMRVKGIVLGEKSYLNLQYIPGDLIITDCDISGDTICFIGKNLKSQDFENLFSGV